MKQDRPCIYISTAYSLVVELTEKDALSSHSIRSAIYQFTYQCDADYLIQQKQWSTSTYQPISEHNRFHDSWSFFK